MPITNGDLAKQRSISLGALGVIVLTAVILISLSFFYGQFLGDDFDFHVDSWMEVAQQWHQGVVYPSWAAGAWGGFGEPRFIFYPPMSRLMGAGLGEILPWRAVPGAFLFLTLVLAGISMHRLARSWLSADAALAAAVIYMASPYHMMDIYVRSAFSEILAGAFLPLVLLCVLNCARDEHINSPRPHRGLASKFALRNVALLSIAYALVWLTNAPAAVLTSYAIAFLLIILAFRRRSLAPLWQGSAGIALGLMLASAYIIPAVFEQRWVVIEEAISEPLVYANSFIFQWITDPGNHVFNVMITYVAVFEIAIAFAAAFFVRRRTGKFGTAGFALLALAILSIVFMLQPTGYPLQYLPKMRFLQFPWRWLTLLGISFAAFFGGAIVRARRRLALGLIYLIILAGTGKVICKYFAKWDATSEEIRMADASIQNGKGYDGVVEYRPDFGEEADLPIGVPLVELLPVGTERLSAARSEQMNGTVSIESWLAQNKIFTITSPAPVVAAVHLLEYPAWQVRINGRPADRQADSYFGQILLALPTGASHVEIRFGWTRDRTAGCAVSGIGILILISCTAIGWRGKVSA
jgi:hypothetical protein